MTDTSGRTSPQQFAFYDPDGSCWRTWPAISLWGSETYSGTWPKRGSMRSGACFEHPTWEPPTSVPACSSWLPTPAAAHGMGGRRATNLEWDGGTAYRPSGAKASVSLQEALDLLPTPVVNDMGDGKTLEWWDDWTSKMQAQHGNGNGHGRSLAIEAMRLDGDATTQRSPDGNTSSVGRHPRLPMTEDD